MYILNQDVSIAHPILLELRDPAIQQDPWRFRQNLARLGELLAYEVSKALPYQAATVATVLGEAEGYQLTQQPILISVLRAGMPFFEGFQRMFDRAPAGFIGAYRQHATTDDTEFDIFLGYKAAPSLQGRQVILIDPMLATGASLLEAMEALKAFGTPAHWHLVAAIAAPEGVVHLQKHVPENHSLWMGALDEKLNDKKYIVPGLGDAGDLAYGPKL